MSAIKYRPRPIQYIENTHRQCEQTADNLRYIKVSYDRDKVLLQGRQVSLAAVTRLTSSRRGGSSGLNMTGWTSHVTHPMILKKNVPTRSVSYREMVAPRNRITRIRPNISTCFSPTPTIRPTRALATPALAKMEEISPSLIKQPFYPSFSLSSRNPDARLESFESATANVYIFF